VWLVLSGLPQWARGDETSPAHPPPHVQIARLIAELDADEFRLRRRAELALIRLGPAVLPAVEQATRSASPEVRSRARRILLAIQHERLAKRLTELVAQEHDEQIDLLEGMLLISEFVDPQTDRAAIVKQLDDLAAAVRRKLGPHVTPHEADPRQVVDALRELLFVDEKFTGNAADFDNPHNSSLARVLATRQGLPILLSHLTIAVGERLKLPLVGLSIPRRYMVKYDGLRAPAGFPKTDIIIDAYDSGRTVTVDELEEIVSRLGGGFDPMRDLAPATHRTALGRMLRNLIDDYTLQANYTKAWQAQEYWRIVEGDAKE
jgi:regulator of sirC expression with transglutaminase-like and TPR domain